MSGVLELLCVSFVYSFIGCRFFTTICKIMIDSLFCSRLPDADKGSKKMTIEHVRNVFNRMGFNDREIVALLGAHALGRCHTDASGYWGPWTFAGKRMKAFFCTLFCIRIYEFDQNLSSQ